MLKINGNATLFAIGQKGTPFALMTSKDGKTQYVRGSLSSSAGRTQDGKTVYTHDLTFTAFGVLAQQIVAAASGCYIAIWDADVQDASYTDQNNVFHARTNVVIGRAEIIRPGVGGQMPTRATAPATTQAAPVQAQTPAPAPAMTPQYTAPAAPVQPQYTAPAAPATPVAPAPAPAGFNVTDAGDPWAGYIG